MAMVKPILVLSLLLALPPATGRLKPPTVEELQEMKSCVKNLEDMVAEHEERLRLHKAENEALRKQMTVLEAKLAALEKNK
jgi:septal ring factor EnvC (AmiA/AmiB activator)